MAYLTPDILLASTSRLCAMASAVDPEAYESLPQELASKEFSLRGELFRILSRQPAGAFASPRNRLQGARP